MTARAHRSGWCSRAAKAFDDFDLTFAFNAGLDPGQSHLYLAGMYPGGLPMQIGYRKDSATMKLVVGYNGGTAGGEAVIPGLTDYNQWAMIRIRHVGRSIQAKAWDYGTAEPGTWLITGRLGPWVAGGGGLQFRFRDVRVDNVTSIAVPAADKQAAAAAEQLIENQTVTAAQAAIEQGRKRNASVRVVDAAGHNLAGVKVTINLARHEFRFGGQMDNWVQGFANDQQRQAYKQRFSDLFNAAVINEFYWLYFEPVQGQPDYALIDQLLAFCQQNHMKVKGHTLLWDSYLCIPPWSSGQPSAAIQQAHVTQTMQHYAGQIDQWEVVNEPASLHGVSIDPAYRWAGPPTPTPS